MKNKPRQEHPRKPLLMRKGEFLIPLRDYLKALQLTVRKQGQARGMRAR